MKAFFLLMAAIGVSVLLWSGCGRQSSPPAGAGQGNQGAPAGKARNAPSVDPQAITANNRGVGLMGKFQFEDARLIFQQLIDQYPDWLEVRTNLAIATFNRQREGDEDAALRIFERVLQEDPEQLRARYCSGLLRLHLQSAEDALPHFQFVADADPDDAYAAYYVGQCLAQDRKYNEAIEWYDKALKTDPYLRSGYYAKAQAQRGAGHDDEARQALDEFQQMQRNPRAHLVEFKYTRMGPKSQALAVDLIRLAAPTSKPEGPVFADPVPLLDDGERVTWKAERADRPVSITACDINGDGFIDVFIADALDDPELRNAVCINQSDGHFRLDANHILSMIPDVNAALWGDYDNDGLTDVYLCRRGPNMLWRQVKKNRWQNVSGSTGTADGEFDTVDGAMVDFDHDGDLDIFCVNADGPNELLNNNLDGTFRPIANERGIAGSGKGSRQVLPVDLDGDRDLDIIVINREPPHDVWINDRLWQYRAALDTDQLAHSTAYGILADDLAANGAVELITMHDDWAIARLRWRRDRSRQWTAVPHGDPPDVGVSSVNAGFIVDVSGDGPPNLLLGYAGGCVVWENGAALGWIEGLHLGGQRFVGWNVVYVGSVNGPAVVGLPAGTAPLIWRPGPSRYAFASLAFSGGRSGETMRSNASGIGTHYAARIDSMWVTGSTLRNSSGPGQSLQPVAIGLGGHSQIDMVTIDWSDGVFQSEVDLKAGELHSIAETQRQTSSCPVLFAWNGTKYEFITDVLGVGGLGYMVAPGEYAPARPWEHLLLPEDTLHERDGRILLKLDESMEEACYLDAAKLLAYDLPPGWRMTIDERMSIQGPEVTGDPRFYQQGLMRPAQVTNDRGEDVTMDVKEVDGRAAPVGSVDSRFIGRLRNEHVLTLRFDQPIDAAQAGVDSEGAEPMLIADGWIEYPYSQTMFAAWQAGADYRAPTIEARGADGQWRTVLEQSGYPAGMPRQMSLPLRNLPAHTTQLRISTNQEIYWDRLAVALAEPCPQHTRHVRPLMTARLAQVGFARRSTDAQRRPSYDYDQRTPLWDTRHQSGWYTRFGPVERLLAHGDGALAIFGPGEEIHLEFAAPASPPPPGWSRRYVLELHGWCKDMDLFTKDGETIEPLPAHEPVGGEQANGGPTKPGALHGEFNTRFEAGR